MEQDPENVGKFINTVDKLTQWEDKHDAKENVKTVSRLLQSFERTAIRTLITRVKCDSAMDTYKNKVLELLHDTNDDDDEIEAAGTDVISVTANTIRRSNKLFDVFAAVVASHISYSDATNGTRNTTNHMCKLLEKKMTDVCNIMIRAVNQIQKDEFIRDTIGLPLMDIDGSMCISRGVLVVCPGSVSATYVLDIEPQRGESPASLDLSNVKTINILQVLDEKDHPSREDVI